MGAGAPKENKNAEKWTLEEAQELFNKALELSLLRDYDFIGEIARDLGTYHHVFKYLSEKFTELKPIHNQIVCNVEANCFFNIKKENINVASGIINLKSNHGWSDRQQTDITTNGKEININPIQWEKGQS